jgi:uncharacterized protein (TIGR02145 family)
LPGYCWYNNDASTNKNLYGALYNWYAVYTGKLYPTGWHVSTDSDWKTLEMFLGMTQAEADDIGYRGTDQGTQLKSKTGWIDRDADIGTDIVGFSALPGGFRNNNGIFNQSGYIGSWWVPEVFHASTAWSRYMDSFNDILSNRIYRDGNQYKEAGLSVRCIKD